jgi:hypothetical protein
MTEVKGRYTGGVVVLDEPAPVDGDTEVIVQFPDRPTTGSQHPSQRRFHWDESQELLGDLRGKVTEELFRQRSEG